MSSPRELFFRDINAIFERALADGNYGAALKAKEILGKEQGFISASGGKKGKSESGAGWHINLDGLSDEALQELVEHLRRQQSGDKETLNH